jgi:RimJ/RimL family protein N-acetyltransferase
MILLETARLRLRRFTSGDIEQLVELDSDPEVMRYITYGEPTSREEYEQDILPRWLEIYATTPLLGYWAAEQRQTGEFLGWFHLRPDRIEPEHQELGYRLRRAVWGRGYATEGGTALVGHGFGPVAAGSISARALVGHRASQRVMQKCGLRYAGEFVFPQHMLEDRSESERAGVKYCIRREQWAPPT